MLTTDTDLPETWVVLGDWRVICASNGWSWMGERDAQPLLLVSSVPAQDVKQTLPPTPRFTLQEAWVRLDASLVEHWVNGETEVELDLLDMGRVKMMMTQRRGERKLLWQDQVSGPVKIIGCSKDILNRRDILMTSSFFYMLDCSTITV